MRHRIEQRRLARVRVADQRARRQRHRSAGGTARLPLPLDHLEALAQSPDAPPDQTAVDLDLRLARAAAQPYTSALSLQVGPATGKAWKQVFELCHLHLDSALGSVGASREDGQDHLGAVQHRHVPLLLQVALLSRCQCAVAEHGRLSELCDPRGERVHHAGAKEGCRMRVAQRDQRSFQHVSAERARELLELVQLDLHALPIPAAGRGADDDHTAERRADAWVGAGDGRRLRHAHSLAPAQVWRWASVARYLPP